jgi:cob(I)alamin adenosyltransferase
MKTHKGLIIVNTGDGKGKTTAALGQIVRAWGRDLRVGGIQFIKSEDANYGEYRALKRMGIDVTPLGDGCTWTSRNLDETAAKAINAWETAKQRMESGEYDLFLLDEFTFPMYYGWLEVGEVVLWLQRRKPAQLHLIITGRYAPPELIACADMVTEMTVIKHPFTDQGIPAQKGIEF